ncbi:hypothetical protein SOP50_003050 [Salmonella enterica]|uniref:hypothetical protein n=1 Tax=Salmonella enterica TaxID=28901 RepID=UPI0009AD2CE9|nr:hypothetical protein [Salmonella enterica]EEO8296397.1 hypothetical protein [Salmonella enterica]EFR7790369.1 hypothetical protein [Salmonella enterica]EIO2507229.1 hypothetical protein [Salmonella enterica]EIY1193403.1 hypothetical protein [Salmonella enterica]ELD6976737.1 hypothetical protein [Salmonella enterica]
MTTITREQLIEKLQNRIAVTANYPGVEEAQLDAAIFKIALASLEAEPIGAFHIEDQQVSGTTDYIKDGEWPIDNGVIEVYAAPPARDNKQTDELVMWVKRLAHSLRNARPNSKLHDAAMDYLSRKGLISVEDVLR